MDSDWIFNVRWSSCLAKGIFIVHEHIHFYTIAEPPCYIWADMKLFLVFISLAKFIWKVRKSEKHIHRVGRDEEGGREPFLLCSCVLGERVPKFATCLSHFIPYSHFWPLFLRVVNSVLPSCRLWLFPAADGYKPHVSQVWKCMPVSSNRSTSVTAFAASSASLRESTGFCWSTGAGWLMHLDITLFSAQDVMFWYWDPWPCLSALRL